MDFALNDSGDDPFPTVIASDAPNLRWQSEDWDPSLRFWTLGWDSHLGEWLKSQDTSQRSILAAREFAKEDKKWRYDEAGLLSNGWLNQDVHLGWKYGNGTKGTTAAYEIKRDIEQLLEMMEDDRDRYLGEINAQADGLAAYLISFLGIDSERRPYTIELIHCGLAIGNIFYFNYKELFRRVRPSTICPGLVPPFGPPRHPAFPSGHSFLGHFIALLLLEIPEVAAVYGEDRGGQVRGRPKLSDVMSTTYVFKGPLLWLGDRLAKNRERAGLHYPSDSAASRWLAGALWARLTTGPNATAADLANATPPAAQNNVTVDDLINCPTLQRVLHLCKAEWVR